MTCFVKYWSSCLRLALRRAAKIDKWDSEERYKVERYTDSPKATPYWQTETSCMVTPTCWNVLAGII